MPTRNKEIDRPTGVGKVHSQNGEFLAQVIYRLTITQREEEVSPYGTDKSKWCPVGVPTVEGTMTTESCALGGAGARGKTFTLTLNDDDDRTFPVLVNRWNPETDVYEISRGKAAG